MSWHVGGEGLGAAEGMSWRVGGEGQQAVCHGACMRCAPARRRICAWTAAALAVAGAAPAVLSTTCACLHRPAEQPGHAPHLQATPSLWTA